MVPAEAPQTPPGAVAGGLAPEARALVDDYVDRLSVVVDAAPVLLAYVDRDERYRFNNESYERWFGVSRADVFGRTLREVLGDAAYEAIREFVRRALQGERIRYSRGIPYRGGGLRHIEAEYIPHVLPDGAIAGFVAIVSDLTERVALEEAERRATARLRLLAEASRVFAEAPLDLLQVGSTIVREIGVHVGDYCALLLTSDDGRWLAPLAQYHRDAEAGELIGRAMAATPQPATDGVSGRVLATGKTVFMPDVDPAVLRAAIRPEFRPFVERFPVRSLIVVPIRVSGRTIGTLATARHGRAPYTDEDRTLLEDLADRAALSIRHAQLYQAEQLSRIQAEKITRQKASLYAVAEALAQSLRVEESMAVGIRESHAVLAATASVAYLREGDRLRLAAEQGLDPEVAASRRELALDDPLPLATAVKTGEPIWLESWEELVDRYPSLRSARTSPDQLRSVLALPLRIKGEVLGGMAFSFDTPRSFASEEKDFLIALARQVAVAVDRARLFESERRAASRLQVVTEASRALFEAKLDPREVLATICHEVAARIGDSCTVNLIDPKTSRLDLAATHHDDPEVLASIRRTLEKTPVSLGEGVVGGVAKSGIPVLIPVVPVEQLVAALRPEYRSHHERFPISSLVVVPIRISRRILGTLTVARDRGHAAFTAEDQALLQELADRAGLAVEHARLFKQAEEAIEARDEFLAVASHELRTPLTSLQLQVQSLERIAQQAGERLPVDRLTGKLEIVGRQVDRLGVLVSNLLDVSRAGAGKFVLELERVDLAGVAREAVGRLKEEAQRAGSELVLRAEPCSGEWDRLRLDQIVTNLLSNAIKFGGGKPIQVEVTGGERAVIRVRDEGIGILPEDQARIFERFERAVSKRNYGGLGLGLWIVRQIVEALNGEIALTSAPGQGSEFTVVLPLRPPSPLG